MDLKFDENLDYTQITKDNFTELLEKVKEVLSLDSKNSLHLTAPNAILSDEQKQALRVFLDLAHLADDLSAILNKEGSSWTIAKNQAEIFRNVFDALTDNEFKVSNTIELTLGDKNNSSSIDLRTLLPEDEDMKFSIDDKTLNFKDLSNLLESDGSKTATDNESKTATDNESETATDNESETTDADNKTSEEDAEVRRLIEILNREMSTNHINYVKSARENPRAGLTDIVEFLRQETKYTMAEIIEFTKANKELITKLNGYNEYLMKIKFATSLSLYSAFLGKIIERYDEIDSKAKDSMVNQIVTLTNKRKSIDDAKKSLLGNFKQPTTPTAFKIGTVTPAAKLKQSIEPKVKMNHNATLAVIITKIPQGKRTNKLITKDAYEALRLITATPEQIMNNVDYTTWANAISSLSENVCDTNARDQLADLLRGGILSKEALEKAFDALKISIVERFNKLNEENQKLDENLALYKDFLVKVLNDPSTYSKHLPSITENHPAKFEKICNNAKTNGLESLSNDDRGYLLEWLDFLLNSLDGLKEVNAGLAAVAEAVDSDFIKAVLTNPDTYVTYLQDSDRDSFIALCNNYNNLSKVYKSLPVEDSEKFHKYIREINAKHKEELQDRNKSLSEEILNYDELVKLVLKNPKKYAKLVSKANRKDFLSICKRWGNSSNIKTASDINRFNSYLKEALANTKEHKGSLILAIILAIVLTAAVIGSSVVGHFAASNLNKQQTEGTKNIIDNYGYYLNSEEVARLNNYAFSIFNIVDRLEYLNKLENDCIERKVKAEVKAEYGEKQTQSGIPEEQSPEVQSPEDPSPEVQSPEEQSPEVQSPELSVKNYSVEDILNTLRNHTKFENPEIYEIKVNAASNSLIIITKEGSKYKKTTVTANDSSLIQKLNSTASNVTNDDNSTDDQNYLNAFYNVLVDASEITTKSYNVRESENLEFDDLKQYAASKIDDSVMTNKIEQLSSSGEAVKIHISILDKKAVVYATSGTHELSVEFETPVNVNAEHIRNSLEKIITGTDSEKDEAEAKYKFKDISVEENIQLNAIYIFNDNTAENTVS